MEKHLAISDESSGLSAAIEAAAAPDLAICHLQFAIRMHLRPVCCDLGGHPHTLTDGR